MNSHFGLTPGCIADGLGHPPNAVLCIVQKFVHAGLMVILDGGVYLSLDGRAAAAVRDRLNPNAVHQLMAALTDENPAHRRRLMEHDRDVARLAAQIKKVGVESYPGWRLEVHYLDKTTLRPDLWALIPVGNGSAMWHAVEVERSALSDSGIDRRVGNYRRVQEAGDRWPQLWVVGKGVRSKKGREHDDDATGRYVTRCGDLPLLVLPNTSPWQRPYAPEVRVEAAWRDRPDRPPDGLR